MTTDLINISIRWQLTGCFLRVFAKLLSQLPKLEPHIPSLVYRISAWLYDLFCLQWLSRRDFAKGWQHGAGNRQDPQPRRRGRDGRGCLLGFFIGYICTILLLYTLCKSFMWASLLSMLRYIFKKKRWMLVQICCLSIFLLYCVSIPTIVPKQPQAM